MSIIWALNGNTLPIAMIDEFKSKIESYVKVSDEFLSELQSNCKLVKLKKNDVLVKYGGIYRKAFFIKKGSFKSSLLTPDGSSKTTWFYFDELFTIIPIRDSFLSGKPTKYEITALEESEVLEIEMSAVNVWLKKFPEFGEFFRLDMINDFIMGEEIRTHLLCYSKKDFLQYLHKHFPVIVLRTPSRALADFIGVTPEWYSKLKRKLVTLKT
ncbi:MAG: Crp/Fnr family transcriptional regulator [Bacteroidota bacterium]